MNWNRLLWAVEMLGPNTKPMIIGEAWHAVRQPAYKGEPPRALLFNTRKNAREWCKAELAKYKGRNDDCALWRFKPVRVNELIKVCP